MFTGIITQRGSVGRLTRRGGGAVLEIAIPGLVGELTVGDSIAVNGACVTVTATDDSSFRCDLVPETIARTNLGTLQPDEAVNLELPVRASDRLDGHIVQGHVDVVGLVRSRRRVGAQEMLEVTIPFELTPYLAPKGSVALEGVSLSVVDVGKDRFRVALIPHTIATTNLGEKPQGSSVNVEVDILSKYVQRHLAARTPMRSPPFLAVPPRAGEPPLGVRGGNLPGGRAKAGAPSAARPGGAGARLALAQTGRGAAEKAKKSEKKAGGNRKAGRAAGGKRSAASSGGKKGAASGKKASRAAGRTKTARAARTTARSAGRASGGAGGRSRAGGRKAGAKRR